MGEREWEFEEVVGEYVGLGDGKWEAGFKSEDPDLSSCLWIVDLPVELPWSWISLFSESS